VMGATGCAKQGVLPFSARLAPGEVLYSACARREMPLKQ
jgi:hypothetical protein